MTTSDSLKDFQDLLRDLFQFDVADLDFGVYRILNEKRDDIERFIEEDLVEGVREELEAYEAGKTEELREEVEAKQSEIRAALGEEALLPDGSISEAYEGTPLAQEYKELQEDLEAASLSVETERHIYDDLARFFNRYYDSGDFVTKRRFATRDSKYYVPYDGEEVMLHWANRDQYYVKTTEHFRDYRFSVRDMDVHFKLVDAQVPQDNVKASDTRYFVLQGRQPSAAVTVDADAKTCTIQFAYRSITEEEDERLLERYNEGKSKSNQRKTNDRSTIVAATTEQILYAIDDATVRTNLGQPEEGKEKSPLRRHLNRYTAKHTADYFVQKDLGGFLRGQLEFFIQNEVLQLDDVLEASERRRTHQVDRAKVVKKIGERIIDFLAQIEKFQKRLFEKKKFVVDTGYCVTLDRVPEDLYPDVCEEDKQLKEWQTEEVPEKDEPDLFSQNGATPEYLQNYPNWCLDTGNFESAQDFHDDLKSSVDSLDSWLDGILLSAENFQALRLLEERFRESVKCIYIDPPYNTSSDDFLYKDNFRRSSWLSMMEDRLRKAQKFLHPKGAIAVSIDSDEIEHLLKLMDKIFGRSNRVNLITVKRGSVTGAKVINPGVVNVTEYVALYAKSKDDWDPNRVYRERDRDERYSQFIENREEDPSEWRFISLLEAFAREVGVPKSEVKDHLCHDFEDRLTEFVIENADSVVQKASIDESSRSEDAVSLKHKSERNPGEVYRLERDEHDDLYITDGRIILFYSDRIVEIGDKKVPGESISDIWDDVLPNDLHNEGGVSLRKGKKPESLISRIFELTTNEGDLVLDFFVGSGTSCAAAQKMDRKWIGIDFADFFEYKTKNRLINTLEGDESGISSQYGWDGGGAFAYHRLESYEDTLNNIKVEKPDTELDLMDQFDDYALHYMLPMETRESDTLLAPEAFEKPFDYTLRIQHGMESPTAREVDLESTFNYLIGLEVKARRVYEHQDRRYVVVTGQVEREQAIDEVMVVWRNRDDLDLDEEKEWAADTLPDGPFDTVYVNGPSHIRGKAEPTEIVFRERMDPAAG